MTVSLSGWADGDVAPAILTADVVVPKFAVKTEPVSRRWIRSMPHPDRKSSLPIVAFAPDGRLLVGGYPSGVLQVLDPTSGKEIRTIEGRRGYRGSMNHMQLTKDFRKFIFALDDMSFETVREGEKKSYFRRYSGEIRVYDIGTGVQEPPLRADPRRGVAAFAVSPDATKIATMEFASGRNEDFADKLRAMYLWDVPSRTAIKLRDGYGDPNFSPDGKTVFIAVNDSANKAGMMYWYDAATGQEIGKRESKDGPWSRLVFSPDGDMAATGMLDSQTKKPIVQFCDASTLAPQFALGADGVASETGFGHVIFSPDGKQLAAVAKANVFLWDLTTRKLVKSWPLDTPGRVWHLTFDPDGRRLAASTWYIPPEMQNARDEAVTPQDYPQPKVFLIDVNAGKPETIVCPHGWWGRPAFSPDGKLLAVGGAGATHLFDVTK